MVAAVAIGSLKYPFVIDSPLTKSSPSRWSSVMILPSSASNLFPEVLDWQKGGSPDAAYLLLMLGCSLPTLPVSSLSGQKNIVVQPVSVIPQTCVTRASEWRSAWKSFCVELRRGEPPTHTERSDFKSSFVVKGELRTAMSIVGTIGISVISN